MADTGLTVEEQLAALAKELQEIKKYGTVDAVALARRKAKAEAEEEAREKNRIAVAKHRARKKLQDKYNQELAAALEKSGRIRLYLNETRTRVSDDLTAPCPHCGAPLEGPFLSIAGKIDSWIAYDDEDANDPENWDRVLWIMLRNNIYTSYGDRPCPTCNRPHTTIFILAPCGDESPAAAEPRPEGDS